MKNNINYYSKLDRSLTQEELNDLDSLKVNERKRNRRIFFITLPLFLLVIALIVTSILGLCLKFMSQDGAIIMLALSGFALMTLLAFLPLYKTQSKVDKRLREKIFTQAIKDGLYPSAYYQSHYTLNKNFLKEVGISPLDIEKTRDKILYTYDKDDILVMDLASVDPVKETLVSLAAGLVYTTQAGPLSLIFGGVNASQYVKDTFRKFDGTLLVLTGLVKKATYPLQAISKNDSNPTPFLLKKEDRLETESIAFNKEFDLYCKNKEEGFYFFTPQLLWALIEIEKEIPTGISLVFSGNNLILGLNNFHLDLEKVYQMKDKLGYKELYDSIVSKLGPLKVVTEKLDKALPR